MIDWFLRKLEVWERQWKAEGNAEMLDEVRDLRHRFELVTRAELALGFVIVVSLAVAVVVVAVAVGWELGA